MIVSLIKEEKINSVILPNKCYGVYWVVDYLTNGEEKKIISIEANDNNWVLNSNSDVTLIKDNIQLQTMLLEEYKFYDYYDQKTKKRGIIYCEPTYDKTYEKYNVNKNIITVGKNMNCDIRIFNDNFDDIHMNFEMDINGNFIARDHKSKNGVYVNGNRIKEQEVLHSGDIIFICGLKVIVLFENKKIIFLINNPNKMVYLNIVSLTKITGNDSNDNYDELFDEDAIVYTEDEYFHKKPRFQEKIEKLNVVVDPPPQKVLKSDMPIILTVGPMLTSGAISLLYGYMTISNAMRSGSSIWKVWPTLLVCILSLMGTLVWPFIIRKYNKYKIKKNEKNRVKKYNEYINKIINDIKENAEIQRKILINNNPSLDACKIAIETKDSNLWNRKTVDLDFLNVSIGNGDIPMQIDFKIPESHFSLDRDELIDNLVQLKCGLPQLKFVPITYNFFQRKITASIGNYNLNKKFVDRIIFQLSTLHSYDDLKIVVFSNEIHDIEREWEYIKILPHSWSDDKSIRFYGTTKDEIREICHYLDNIFTSRLEKRNNSKDSIIPYYLIITDNYKTARNFDFIKRVLDLDQNIGFGLFIINDKLFNLPAECDNFININSHTSEFFQNALNCKPQQFDVDFNTPIDMYYYSKLLANIPIEIDGNNNGNLVNKMGFLELYGVGKIEHLNILSRWRESNPTGSLQALIGIGKGDEKIYLDLHEKYHGPHGLIAGMTGSGKSEFIATYILSLAVNYHPDEVQFILIDYKGGGLAGIFENKITGIKIPHLIGTITNLDVNEIQRSLASLDSEIKRRQIIFSNVRDQLSDSVIDIYKYQQLHRDGIVSEPLSHLFIICDEFAELKSQQPEFLQQLISISRIGRSLGIHLILATQKPSGVVDNQIWSNSKFRVCLRVQEKSDSTEVIKCPDAAFLKNAGRFYLQVGYNEVFVLGQAAWAGGKYIPSEKIKKKIDTSIKFVNNNGFVIKKVDSEKKADNNINLGEEITNIIGYINNLANQEGIYNKNLWLDKIPEYININDLKRKYNFIKTPFQLNIPIGEYDNPRQQMQNLLTIPFYKEGNVLVYGATGSGKENFITTMLYSSITSYMPEESIFYVIDCGTGFLNVYNDIPQIGDVISSDDFEKVKNLFKMLDYMIEERKSLFADYNGDYGLYCQKSGDNVPSIVVVINNYDSYVEMYPQYDDKLIQLTREGNKFGMYFVITVSNASIVRTKLKQNFKLNYVLQQNNITDYSNILGNVNKKYPSKIFGRGIVVLDDVYEFQTAMVSESDKIYDYIEKIKPILIENCDVLAMSVPVLPKVVSKNDIISEINLDSNVIIGIEKESLSVVKYNFKNNYTNLVLFNDISIVSLFLNPLLEQINEINYYDLIIINADNLEINKNKFMCYDSDFDNIFINLSNFIEQENNKYKMNGFQRKPINNVKMKLCFIMGFDSFKRKLTPENAAKLGNILEKGKDLGIINFVIIDSVDKFREYSFESWYKTIVSDNRGIFIGNGVTQQMIIKLSVNDRSLSTELPYNFCCVINHGKPSIVKYVEVYDSKE